MTDLPQNPPILWGGLLTLRNASIRAVFYPVDELYCLREVHSSQVQRPVKAKPDSATDVASEFVGLIN